jgi:hypothetical protein
MNELSVKIRKILTEDSCLVASNALSFGDEPESSAVMLS